MMSSVYNRKETFCPVCRSCDVSHFVEIPQVPIHCNLLWETRSEALNIPKGDIKLGFCSNCCYIFNVAFEPEWMQYDQSYENSLHFSSHFQSYAKSLATNLIKRYDLHNKDIIEIGCGKGEFLSLLCKLGHNRGVGFDVSYVPEKSGKLNAKNITYVRDFYSNRYAHYKANLLCCRHVLEHIHNPVHFLTNLRRTIGNRLNTVVFFEVPNVSCILQDLSIWDIIYEHHSYYCNHAISCLFEKCGFKVCDLYETYQGQFLCIEALLADGPTELELNRKDDDKAIVRNIEVFKDEYQSKVKTYQKIMKGYEEAGKRVIIWGAGSKGVSFLNTLRLHNQIEYIVDINPRKQGMYIPGTGQQIVSPDFLKNYQPDVMIIMNLIYKDEIKQRVETLGLNPEFVYP